MKKRLYAAVAALAVISALAAPPANASAVFVDHSHFSGGFADADWQTGNTSTFIEVSKSKYRENPLLLWHSVTVQTDSSGNFTGLTDSTDIAGTGTSTFTIDSRGLTGATLTQSDVLEETCSYDANFTETDCSFTRGDVSVIWSGEGPISITGEHNSHTHLPGMTTNVHYSGQSRAATATGMIFGGIHLTSADMMDASIGFAKNGSTTVCFDC